MAVARWEELDLSRATARPSPSRTHRTWPLTACMRSIWSGSGLPSAATCWPWARAWPTAGISVTAVTRRSCSTWSMPTRTRGAPSTSAWCTGTWPGRTT